YILTHITASFFTHFTPFSSTLFLFSPPETLDASIFRHFSSSPNYWLGLRLHLRLIILLFTLLE
ncbi:hypothetical protein, partial [Nostoc sp. FACHB-280]|uniref:hypothetical protein n=1 Tax=Nostoc sp. FACHB-280 TaxID=2692839 RepID=UPI001A7E6E86